MAARIPSSLSFSSKKRISGNIRKQWYDVENMYEVVLVNIVSITSSNSAFLDEKMTVESLIMFVTYASFRCLKQS